MPCYATAEPLRAIHIDRVMWVYRYGPPTRCTMLDVSRSRILDRPSDITVEVTTPGNCRLNALSRFAEHSVQSSRWAARCGAFSLLFRYCRNVSRRPVVHGCYNRLPSDGELHIRELSQITQCFHEGDISKTQGQGRIQHQVIRQCRHIRDFDQPTGMFRCLLLQIIESTRQICVAKFNSW